MVTQEEIDCRLASAELRGEARGMARAAEAVAAKAREMAKALKANGVDIGIIANSSGLSEDEIRAL